LLWRNGVLNSLSDPQEAVLPVLPSAFVVLSQLVNLPSLV
jgi:hypothetical protein